MQDVKMSAPATAKSAKNQEDRFHFMTGTITDEVGTYVKHFPRTSHLCSMAVRTEKEHLLNALNWVISDAAFRLAPTFIENKPGLDFGVRFMALSQTHCTGSLLGVDGCATALAVDIEVFAPVSTSDAAPPYKI
jgi:hypothetical protein